MNSYPHPVRTELVKLVDLITCPPEKNPNKMSEADYALLVEAMRKSDNGDAGAGVLQTILVAEVFDVQVEHGEYIYEVVDGNHRVQAARELGWDSILARVTTMTRQEVIAYRLGLNKNRGSVDLSVASAIVTELKYDGWSASDMIVTGYAADEIVDLIDARVEGGDAELADAGSTEVPDDEPQARTRPFVLEIEFRTRDELSLARRKLKKAAGKSKDLARGLMAVLGEEK